MSEIVSKWILNRLGLVIDMSPEHFAEKASNGILLGQLLQSYEIITPEELNLLKDSANAKERYENYSLINKWLRNLYLRVNEEDLFEIVRGVGSTALHLFYQVFLELKNKTKLDFLTENEISAQLGSRFHRFYVKPVDDTNDVLQLDLHREGLCEPFLAGGDVYHWYKDRLETIQTRCKDARDEYVHSLKNKCKSIPIDFTNRGPESGYVLPRSLCPSPKQSDGNISPNLLPWDDVDSVDERTYEELINEQKLAQDLPPFDPDPREVKKILKNLHLKSKIRLENRVLKNTLHQEIMNEFDRKINDTKAKSEDQALTNMFMKQSLYEKELVTKLGQVKMQKEFMLDNKFRQGQILKKLMEKEFVDALMLKDKKLNEKKLTYYFERERIIELHKKLWDERMKLKAKRREEICTQAVKDIVEIATKIAEYKKRFGREPNRREMEEIRNLFVTGQSAFDICEPVINIVKDFDEEIPEAIITREIARQNAIDQEEFERYMQYEWPWELKNIDFNMETFLQITYGLNVLGHIVHKALEVKYPITPLWERPLFPEAKIRVCINGIRDPTILPNLKNLLSVREIQVIQLTQAVDFCIAAYRDESKREYEEDETGAAKEGKQKKEKPPRPKKGGKSSNKRKGNVEENFDNLFGEPIKHMENKQVQTPIKYPCEEIAYSTEALLGKTAQDLLDEGRPLGDFLLIAMFVEYLKSIPNLKGWVLINYPTTLEQAAILEEALTGIKLMNTISKSDMDKSLSEFAEQEQVMDEKDECSLNVGLESSRCSRLLPNPVEPEPLKIYDTILTAYIKIKKLTFDDKTGEALLPPAYEELGNEPDPLDKFYSDAGANYSLYYKEFDPATIKYLGKLIIGDFSLPLKSSLELFGEVADLDGRTPKAVKATKKGEKLKKPKIRMEQETTTASDKTSTKVVADKKGKKGKTKVVIVYENKYVQVPSEDEDEIEEIFFKKSASEPPSVGQPGWEYSDNIGPEDLMIALATLWEALEDIYITELRQIFFLRRLNLNSIMPYSQYIKDVMKTVIERPDYKGFFLTKFQKAFNAFSMDFRQDDEFKAEMHCRIEDFKEKMSELCDIKMMDSENMRCKIILSDWTPLQISELINDYVNMIQIEMDRFIETMRFTNDFYLGAVTGLPSDEENYKEENFLKYHNISNEFINNMFQDSTSSIDLTYFDELFSSVIQRTLNCIKRLNGVATSCMEKTKAAQANSTNKSKSKASSPRSKASKDTKKTMEHETGITKENYDKILEEWQCAVKGETLRVTLRIDLIKYNALESIGEFLKEIQQSFHGVYNEIRTKYWNEIENVRKACKVFQMAVENEAPIQKELIFEGHNFRINSELNLFDNPPIIPKLPEEVIEEGAFTIGQLSKLADVLLDLSPGGYIPRGTFTFILQDIIWITPEDGSQWLSPKLWRKLNSQQLKVVVDSIYDNLEYVYWRDFIVYNIRINFPTERELLLTRVALRECDPDGTELIQNYQFFATKLWFEYLFRQEDSKKIMEIKRLLYKIYSIKNYGLNYTALLLDFCKDENPIEGFAKALELSLGKIVCWDNEMGDLFEEEYLSRMKEHDENVSKRDAERDEYYKVAYEEVSKLVDYVVHITESVIIEDLDKPEEKTELSTPSTKTRQQSILKKPIEEGSPKRSSKGEEIKFKESLEMASKDEITITDSDESVPDENANSIEDLESDAGKMVKLYSDLPNNVGTESSDFTEIIFFLPKDVVITIIMAALPWHSRVENIGELSFWEGAAEAFEKCRNPNFNMAVLSHEFLNSDMFSVLLSQTKKFSVIDPVRVVNELLIESDRNSE